MVGLTCRSVTQRMSNKYDVAEKKMNDTEKKLELIRKMDYENLKTEVFQLKKKIINLEKKVDDAEDRLIRRIVELEKMARGVPWSNV